MYKGSLVPTGDLSEWLEDEFSHRIIGELVTRKRLAEEAVRTDYGGQGDDGLPSKIRQMDLAER